MFFFHKKKQVFSYFRGFLTKKLASFSKKSTVLFQNLATHYFLEFSNCSKKLTSVIFVFPQFMSSTKKMFLIWKFWLFFLNELLPLAVFSYFLDLIRQSFENHLTTGTCRLKIPIDPRGPKPSGFFMLVFESQFFGNYYLDSFNHGFNQRIRFCTRLVFQFHFIGFSFPALDFDTAKMHLSISVLNVQN